jgi:hypothetical protein
MEDTAASSEYEVKGRVMLSAIVLSQLRGSVALKAPVDDGSVCARGMWGTQSSERELRGRWVSLLPSEGVV